MQHYANLTISKNHFLITEYVNIRQEVSKLCSSINSSRKKANKVGFNIEIEIKNGHEASLSAPEL